MTTATTVPRWYVVIDPKGAANIVSDLAPGPDAVLPGLKPAGRAEPGGWRDAVALPTARSWDTAVAAMNAHNGRVSPYSMLVSPDAPSAGTPPSTRPTADAATDVDARHTADAPGEDDAAAALATARDPESGMTTRQRNRVLAVCVAVLVLAAGALAVARMLAPHMPEVRALVREVLR